MTKEQPKEEPTEQPVDSPAEQPEAEPTEQPVTFTEFEQKQIQQFAGAVQQAEQTYKGCVAAAQLLSKTPVSTAQAQLKAKQAEMELQFFKVMAAKGKNAAEYTLDIGEDYVEVKEVPKPRKKKAKK